MHHINHLSQLCLDCKCYKQALLSSFKLLGKVLIEHKGPKYKTLQHATRTLFPKLYSTRF